MATVRVSDEGGITIPEEMFERLGWAVGTELAVEEREDGVVMLRTVEPGGRAATIDEVRGCVGYDGPTVSIEKMDEAVMREARKHI